MWGIKYHPKAEAELSKLDESVRKTVLKGILKVAQNPLPPVRCTALRPAWRRMGKCRIRLYFSVCFRRNDC